MRKTFITIAAATVLASSGAWAGKHHPMTEAEQEHCLIINFDEDEPWCVKSDAGMSQSQIDAFRLKKDKSWAESADKMIASIKKAQEASFVNCGIKLKHFQTSGVWGEMPPSLEECRNFADDIADKAEAKRRALLDDEIKALGAK